MLDSLSSVALRAKSSESKLKPRYRRFSHVSPFGSETRAPFPQSWTPPVAESSNSSRLLQEGSRGRDVPRPVSSGHRHCCRPRKLQQFSGRLPLKESRCRVLRRGKDCVTGHTESSRATEAAPGGPSCLHTTSLEHMDRTDSVRLTV